jgi:NitT/TauT family transport system substrate-binding protein
VRRGVALFALLALCILATPPARAQTPVSLHVGTTASEVGAEVFYGVELGYFKRAGLDVQLEILPNGGAVAAAVASGAVDIGLSDVMSVINAHARNVPFVYIAPGLETSITAPTSAIIVARDSTVREAKDLRGVIAVSGLNNIAQIAAMVWIDRNGGDLKQVKFIEMPFPAMPPALAAGTLQAASANEPWLTAATDRGDRVIFEDHNPIAPRFLLGGWITTRDWLAQHQPTAAAFATAIRSIAGWSNLHRAETAPILSKYTKLPVELIGRMHRGNFAEHLDPALIQPVIDAAAKYGVISARFSAADLMKDM